MSDSENYSKLLKNFREWDSVEGLGIFFGCLVTAFLTFFKVFPQLFTYIIFFSFISLLIYYVMWKFKRSAYQLRKKVTIIFAFHNTTGTEAIERYIKNFKAEISDKIINFYDAKIELCFMPSDLEIGSVDEADRLIQNRHVGHTLLVWGNVTEFDADIKCPNVKFTYEFFYKKYYPDISEKQAKAVFGQIIQDNIKNYNWNLNLFFRKFLCGFCIQRKCEHKKRFTGDCSRINI